MLDGITSGLGRVITEPPKSVESMAEADIAKPVIVESETDVLSEAMTVQATQSLLNVLA